MKVRELLALLADADPESVVLFLDAYAGSDESDEVREVVVPKELWTRERGYYGGIKYDIRYPGKPRSGDEEDRTDVQRSRERVVVLSTGETDLTYVG